MSNKQRKHKNATSDDDATKNQSQESSMRETLNDFAYFQEVWDKSMQPTNTAKKRKSNKQNNIMDVEDDISTTSSLQSSHFSFSSDGSSMQPKKKRRKSNINKHDDTSITNANDIYNKKEEDTKTSNYNAHSKKRRGRHTHRYHNNYQTLYHNMSIQQVDELVGWTHSLSDNANNHNCNTIDDKKGSEVERGIVELTHTSTAAPPPPSHIAYLQHQISDRLESGSSRITTEDTSDERIRSVDINIRRDVDISTYSAISKHNHDYNMDTSAYIAIGMAIEERLTRSLMPLANAHVERCRRLELDRRNTSSMSGGIVDSGANTNTNELTSRTRLTSDPFHAWNLPAAKAVAELAKDGYTTSNAVSELLGVSQKAKSSTSSKDSSSSESSTSSSSDDS